MNLTVNPRLTISPGQRRRTNLQPSPGREIPADSLNVVSGALVGIPTAGKCHPVAHRGSDLGTWEHISAPAGQVIERLCNVLASRTECDGNG